MSLARVEPHTNIALPERVTLEGQLALWKDVAEFAHHIAATEFVPKDLRNKPASVAAAMLRANELGISPMQGLAQIHVINGRPGLAAELMRALVQAAGHEIWTEDYTQTRVTMCGKRAGSDHVEKVTWTPDDVKRAGLGGDSHRKYPRAMLMARATAELCRLNFADVLAGMSYAVEELVDMTEEDDFPGEPVDEETTEAPKTQPRKAAGTAKKAAPRRRAALPSGSPPEPPLPGEDDSVDATATEPDELVLKRAQQIAIKAGEANVDHHHVVAAVTNGEKTSAKAVTAEEASQVIDALHRLRDGELVLEQDGDIFRLIERPEGEEIPENEWSADKWKAFMADHNVTLGNLLREANRICTERGEKPPTSLDALRGQDALCGLLVTWVEGQS